jgi:3-hydroxymyristoyl/3-hydroxydecanoyl-(acyl carrier protein) dehydratase
MDNDDCKQEHITKFRKKVLPGDPVVVKQEGIVIHGIVGASDCRFLVNGKWYPQQACEFPEIQDSETSK